jgi:hypothetical protein
VLAFAERAVAVVLPLRWCAGQEFSCVSRLLGRVVAHEIGHVLLDSLDHAPEGLMRPDLGADAHWRRSHEAYRLAADQRTSVLRRLGRDEPAAVAARAVQR